MGKLSKYLCRTLNLPEDQATALESLYTPKMVKKGDYLLKSGEVSHHVFFVEKGLLRMYTIGSQGKEHIIQFAPEEWLIGDRSSIFFNQKSQYHIDAIEHSKVYCLPGDFFIKLRMQLPELTCTEDLLLHKHIQKLQNRVISLLGHTAQERYLSFIKTYPDLIMKVPQWMVASYLGITPESLSRVRKEITKTL